MSPVSLCYVPIFYSNLCLSVCRHIGKGRTAKYFSASSNSRKLCERPSEYSMWGLFLVFAVHACLSCCRSSFYVEYTRSIIIESESHVMICVGRDLQDHLVAMPPAMGRDVYQLVLWLPALLPEYNISGEISNNNCCFGAKYYYVSLTLTLTLA